MTLLSKLKPEFGNIYDEYAIYENENFPSISNFAKYLIAIYNSSDASIIYSKLWKKQALNSVESLYISYLKKAIQELPSVTQNIRRFEINISNEDLNQLIQELKFKKASTVDFECPIFWNFSENQKWELSDHFRWDIIPSITSENKVAHILYGRNGEMGVYEQEVIVQPKTYFEIIEINKKSIILREK